MRTFLAALSAASLMHGFSACGQSTDIDWNADLDFLRTRAIGVHANLHHSIGRDPFERRIRELGEMSAPEHERVVAMAELIALIGDGHSRLTLPLDPQAGLFATHTATQTPNVAMFKQFPIRFRRSADGYVVSAVDRSHAAALGAVLVAINDQSVGDVMQKLAPVVHHDNDEHRRVLMTSFMVLPEVLHSKGISDELDRVTWHLQRSDGSQLSINLTPISTSTKLDWRTLAPDSVPLRDQWPERKHWFTQWSEADALYVRIREIGDDPNGESFVEFSSRLVDRMLAADAKRLVIDLRGNMGGNDSLNWALVQGIVRAERFWRPGGMYVITDGATYSAAVGLCSAIEEMTPAVFVGSATGGSPNGYGDSRRLQLPSSGLTIRLSTRYSQASSFLDKRRAIAPQLKSELTQADLIDGTDSSLNQILVSSQSNESISRSWVGSISFREFSAALSIDLATASDGALQGLLRIPTVGLAERQFEVSPDPNGDWSGEIELSGIRSRIALQIGKEHLHGWIEVNGRPYPVVARLAGGASQ